jgi:predicted GNAT family acetyltransferase
MALMNAFRDNAAARRYELDHADGPSFADYRDQGEARLITHVETPAAARGKGYAAQLMAAIADSARMENVKLVPRCGYAVAYFHRHPEAADVLAP